MAPPTPGVTVRTVRVRPNGQWWVVNTSPPNGGTVYTVMEGVESDSDSLPNSGGISGPYSTQVQASAVAHAEPLNSTQNVGIPGIDVTPGGSLTPANPLTGLNAVGDFFQRLTQGATWVRVGEVAVGGINYMTGGKASKAAKSAGKAAMFL